MIVCVHEVIMSEYCYEIKVTVKDQESNLFKKFVHHDENLILSLDDPEMKGFVNDVYNDFRGEKTDCDVIINVKLVLPNYAQSS